MPKVGKMSFPYTAAGMKAAKMEAQKSNKPMKRTAKKAMPKKMGKKK